MSNEIITAKLDVTKITKERLFKGKKGTYLDVALIPTPDSEYGDWMIVESVSKEERERGTKGPILGNAKIMHSRKRDSAAPEQKPKPTETPDDSSVPF